ncbi:hypothetical protein BZA77DRAFT_220491, partial [Pyronema omphalodes]
LISHLAGPWAGNRRNLPMYDASGLRSKIRSIHDRENPEERCYLYGDEAYRRSYGVISAYKSLRRSGRLDPILRVVNETMAEMQTDVENNFGKKMALWSFNGFKDELRNGLSPVAAYFMVAVLLTNIHGCVHGNETSQQFNCPPPSLHEYL